MAVAIVGTADAVRYNDPTLTVDAAADYLAVASYLGPGGVDPAGTASWNGDSMGEPAIEAFTPGDRFAEIDVFGQANPDAATATVDLGGTGQSGGGAVALSGVHQTAPIADFDVLIATDATAVNLSLEVPAGGKAVLFVRWGGATEAAITPGSGTALEADSTWVEFGRFAVLSRDGNGTQTFACTLSAPASFVAVAVAYAPAASSALAKILQAIHAFRRRFR